jgi:peptidoglycan/xylan/chitin deacetylase (PgdA/CDA1 family)/GT2 family glycosyltransferase
MLRRENARRINRRIERPPAHWSLLVLGMLIVLAILFAQGLSTETTGAAGVPTEPEGEPAHLPSRSPILGEQDGELRPIGRMSPGEVSLTFDDGPDPTWTPRIADLLEREGVPATFFVVGENATRYPELVDDLQRRGFELGNHTFSHANLTQLPSWQLDLQMSLTESAIAGSAGVRPRLMRPPYSADKSAVGEGDLAAFKAVAESGYLVALSTIDSEDWRRPGVDEIVSNSIPESGRGGVVLLHDGGGDRDQTVEALERLIPALRERGFRFTTLSQIAGRQTSEIDLAASESEQLRGELLIGALSVSRTLTEILKALLIPIGLLAVARVVLLVVLARRHARAARRRPPAPDTKPPVSILVPAYNEAAVIEPAVRSLAASDYPDFEVIVIDDGSTDDTGRIVEELDLKRVRLLREANQGKADALNAGLRAASHELIVTVDADTLFEPKTLERVLEPFADPEVGAVAGNTKVANRKGLLGRWQHIEYVMGFNLDRRLYDALQCMPTVPGAIGAFRRTALEPIGGFSSATLAEDTDVTIAIGRAGWRVSYAEHARAHTEAPSTLGALWRQRYRWAYGTMQAVWKHRGAMVRREPGKVGRRGLPYLLLFQIALPTLAPLIDAFAIYGMVFLSPLPAIAAWLGFNVMLLGIGAFAFRLDGDPLRDLWAMPLQQLVYRQLMYLVVIQSLISAARGTRLRWQHIERRGELEAATLVE